MILEILKYPDKRLRTIAKPVENVNNEIKKQVKDMFETMYEAPGIGLAATQVNFHKRIIVIDKLFEKQMLGARDAATAFGTVIKLAVLHDTFTRIFFRTAHIQ